MKHKRPTIRTVKYIGSEGWSIEKIITNGYPAYADDIYIMTKFEGYPPKLIYYVVRSPSKVVRASFCYYKDAQQFIRQQRFPRKMERI